MSRASFSGVTLRAGDFWHAGRELLLMTRQQLEKKPEKPFMMYFAFDDLQVIIQGVFLHWASP